MRHTLSLLAAGLLIPGSAGAIQAGGSEAAADLAIAGVSVVDVAGGRIVPDRLVVIRGGRVVAVEPAGRAPAGMRILEGRGKYLIPGLLDMHVHLMASGNPTAVEMPLFVAHGVTGVRVMSADRPNAHPTATPGLNLHRDWQARIEAGRLVGPRLLALASWPVNGAAGIGANMPAFYKAGTRDEGRQLAAYFKERGFDFIKVYNNLSREGFRGLAEEARRLGLPFAGHEPRPMSAIELSDAGQASIEHSRVFLFNCFAGADSMRQGLLRIAPTALSRRMVDEYDPALCAEVFRTFARNRTWITPTHGTRKMDAFADDPAFRADDRMRYIPVPTQMGWLADADGMVAGDTSRAGRQAFLDFYRRGLSITADAWRAGVPMMVGTDAGDSFIFPGSSVHDELRELVTAGFSPAEALRAATLAGAEFLGRTGDLGAIAPGRLADLVLLDADPLTDVANAGRIRAVILNGRVFDRGMLDSMLVSVELAARPTPQIRLWAAAVRGDTAEIAAALDAGARVDSLDTQASAAGRRALNYAALGNRAAAIRLLLARGASINLANATGFTPALHAVEGGAKEALGVLIEAGADLSLASTSGMTPLAMAQRRGDQAAVRMLEAAAKKP